MSQRTGKANKPNKEDRRDQVIDFTEVRNRRLEEKRRKTERIFFKQTLGIYCVTGSEEKRQIELIDVSENGCSFQVPFNEKDPWPSDHKEVSIRLYFSQDTYLPLSLQIQNSRPGIEEGTRFVIYGCTVDKSSQAYVAYLQFVKFLHAYSEQAHQDTGKVTHFYL